MSFQLETNLARAIHMQQLATGATRNSIRDTTVAALRLIQQRFQRGDYELPRATRTFERQLTLAILMEQDTRNLGLNALIIRTTTAWGRISGRLEQGLSPFPEPYHIIADDGDEDISIEERLRRMGLDPNNFDLTGIRSDAPCSSNNGNNVATAQPQTDMGSTIGTGGIISSQAAVLARAIVQTGKAAVTGKPRGRKRGKDMYGCDVCNQAKRYTSACTLYRHKKSKHGIPTPGDVRKERKLAAEAALAAQDNAEQGDGGEEDEDAEAIEEVDETMSGDTGDERDLE
ncbi:hypothetical protein CTAM01_09476 [Colletotrichum tamarilloi]|uniref:C2H2-type domain-containing protein n=1 Tax=Colletotrichum tamarilloi TaxID=1209934 RepID=A0ABQ9R3I2_9PEZI|nr:uncharacterized protein CTAM01_09476 [Colletotrichum tamarilloi]KAK1493332.1 hypothetical protein CTAM01_09476 [Colletotrichum tamarilloi]